MSTILNLEENVNNDIGTSGSLRKEKQDLIGLLLKNSQIGRLIEREDSKASGGYVLDSSVRSFCENIGSSYEEIGEYLREQGVFLEKIAERDYWTFDPNRYMKRPILRVVE
ncbi:MAG: hypothetical protein ISS01_00995 [Nanoarchaeota archaeon]|nr:hypothetical protein [Nanoarchaeota archaeon]